MGGQTPHCLLQKIGSREMLQPVLTYDRVEVSYRGVPVVRDVSFAIRPGEVLGIVGESGSGKSTLVKAAMGQLGADGLVTQGDIWYGGKSIPDLSPQELRALCGMDLALVFQDCLAALTPIRTVGDQIHEFMSAHRRISRTECDRQAAELFFRLGLENPRQVLASYPFELSGGMGQRVGIAMALMGEPRVLLADEPTSALDVITQTQVIELFSRIRNLCDAAIVIVTHNMSVVRALADNVLVLRNGLVVEYGNTHEVLGHPTQAYTRQLIDATPRLRGSEE